MLTQKKMLLQIIRFTFVKVDHLCLKQPLTQYIIIASILKIKHTRGGFALVKGMLGLVL